MTPKPCGLERSCAESKMKKVVEFIRVSTESQAGEDRAGIPAQRAANRQTIARYGLECVDTVEVFDVSGAAVLRMKAAFETGDDTEALRLGKELCGIENEKGS